MKRVGNLYDKVTSRESLWKGYLAAKRSKSGKRSCFQFDRNLGENMERLYNELRTGKYRPRPYFHFIVYEPKARDIYAPAFRDCVVQHAVYEHILPIFEPTFIEESFACRIGKGTHKAADYAQAALKRAKDFTYTLQLDIKKFFYSINRKNIRIFICKENKRRKTSTFNGTLYQAYRG